MALDVFKNMRSFRHLAQVLALASLVFASACAAPPPPAPKLTNAIRLGMTKRDLLQVLGPPETVSVGVKQRRGKPADVWAYPDQSKPPEKASEVAKRVFRYGVGSLDHRQTLFYFVDGRLTHWGPASVEPPK